MIAYIRLIYAYAYIDTIYGFAYIYNIYGFAYIERGDSHDAAYCSYGKATRRHSTAGPRQAGLTQSGLGKQIHLRQGTVSRLEAGEPAIQLHTLMEALAALNLELVVRTRSKATSTDIEDIF